MLIFFTNVSPVEFQVRYLTLFRLFSLLDQVASQECPLTAGAPQGFILGPTLFLLYFDDLPYFAIYADDTSVYPQFSGAYDLANN